MICRMSSHFIDSEINDATLLQTHLAQHIYKESISPLNTTIISKISIRHLTPLIDINYILFTLDDV